MKRESIKEQWKRKWARPISKGVNMMGRQSKSYAFLLFTLAVCSMTTKALADDEVRLKVAAEYEKKGELNKALEEYRAILVDEPKNATALTKAGYVELRQKKYESAASYFANALQGDPSSAMSLTGMAQAQEGKGAYEQSILYWRRLSDLPHEKNKGVAEKEIQRLLKKLGGETPPDLVSGSEKASASTGGFTYDGPLFTKALDLYNKGENEKALEAWRSVLKSQPGNPGAYYYAGVNRYNLAQYDKAEINFRKGFSYPEKGFNGHYYLGRIYEKDGKVSEAIAHYQKYLQQTESAAGKKEVKGRIDKLGAMVKASPAQGQVSQEPSLPDLQKKTDSSENKKAEVSSESEAENKDQQFETMQSGSVWVILPGSEKGADLVRNAWKKYRDGKMTDAVDRLKNTMAKFPNSEAEKAAYYNYVALLSELGLDKDAIRQGHLALAKKPGEPYRSALKFFVAKSLFNTSEVDSALGSLKGTHAGGSLGPSVSDFNAFQSALAHSTKKEKESIQKLRLALENENDPLKKMELQLELAKGLAPTQLEEAIGILKDLANRCLNQQESICRQSKLSLGDLLFAKGELKESAFFYEKMISENPDDVHTPWAEYQIGNIHRELGDNKKAISAYNEVVEKHPKSYWAQQAMWKRDDTIWRNQYREAISEN